MPAAPTSRRFSTTWLVPIFSAVLFATSGCASVEVREGQRLDAILAAAKGAPPDKLVRALAANGYACGADTQAASSDKTALACTSQRSNLWPPYSCVFRVALQPAPQDGAAGASPVVSHACAGM